MLNLSLNRVTPTPLSHTLIPPLLVFLLTTSYALFTLVYMLQKPSVSIYAANCHDGINITNWEEQSHPASRGTRAVDHSTRFLIVSVDKKADDHVLRQTLKSWVHEGIDRNGESLVHILLERTHASTYSTDSDSWGTQNPRSSPESLCSSVKATTGL